MTPAQLVFVLVWIVAVYKSLDLPVTLWKEEQYFGAVMAFAGWVVLSYVSWGWL